MPVLPRFTTGRDPKTQDKGRRKIMDMETMGRVYIITPLNKAEMAETKKKVTTVLSKGGFETPEGLPTIMLTAKKSSTNTIEFYFEEQILGMLLNSTKHEDATDNAEVEALIADPTKVFGIVKEEGRTLVADVFNKIDIMKITGEEISEAMLYESKGVDAIKEECLANEGFSFSEEELDERISYARSNGVSDKNICWMLRQLEGEKIAKPPMIYREPMEQVDAFGYPCERGVLERVISAFRLKEHVILDGPKGTGKDVCLETVSWLLNMPFISHTMTMDVTKEDLLGDYITDNSPIDVDRHGGGLKALRGAVNGIKSLLGLKTEDYNSLLNTMAEVFKPKVVFEASSVVTALRTGRCILNFDEMNLAQTGVLSGIVNTIADNHSAYIYVRGVGKVPISTETHVTATMNGLDCDYDGTQPLNVATDDRFKTIRFANPTGSVYDILLSMNTGADNNALLLVDNIFQELRELYLNGAGGVQGVISDKVISMRACRRMLLDLADGVSQYEAFRDNFLNKLPRDEAEVVEPIIVTKLVQPPTVTQL